MASGGQSMIDGDTLKLGLPSALNAGVLFKARYVKTYPKDDDGYDDVGTDRGNFEMFKTSKVFFGGKMAENVGGFMTFEDAGLGGKVAVAYELGSGYAGIVGFMQNDFGPFAGVEYFNTGLYAPLKLFENRKGTNAAQATEVGHGPASGLQAYYGGDILHVMGGAYVPATSKHEGLDVGTDVMGIGRIAVAPTFGDWTVMVGAYGISGKAVMSDMALNNTKPKADSADLVEIERESFGLDMQVEGDIAGASTVLVVNAVLHNKTGLVNNNTNVDKLDDSNGFPDLELHAGDNTAYSVELQVNPWAEIGFKGAFLHYDDKYDYRYSTAGEQRNNPDKWDRDEYTLGVDYSFRQNVRFAFEYTYSDMRINDQLNNEGDVVSISDSNDFYLYAMIGF